MKKFFEKIWRVEDDDGLVCHYKHYYLFGKKIHTKLICIYRYN